MNKTCVYLYLKHGVDDFECLLLSVNILYKVTSNNHRTTIMDIIMFILHGADKVGKSVTLSIKRLSHQWRRGKKSGNSLDFNLSNFCFKIQNSGPKIPIFGEGK